MIRHLLGIEYLTKDEILNHIENSKTFVEVSEREIKKVPALRGKTIINLFLEPSTRTRASFEIAGKRLSADTINISGNESSMVKGESLLDMAHTLQAMGPDVIVMRHKESGAPNLLSRYIKGCSIVNAGDGMHEHPTQALLDCLSLSQYFGKQGRSIEGLNIAIVGDIRHSRVARSNIWAHCKIGNQVNLIGPRTLLPPEINRVPELNEKVKIFDSLEQGIKGVDVVMVLRMQLERMNEHFVPSLEEYCNEYGINEKLLKRLAPESVVLHPGPINRGVELSTEVADGVRSLVKNQVTNGVAVRMAVLFSLCSGNKSEVSQ